MNDYTLLRKINPEELVVGMEVLDTHIALCEFVAGPDDDDDVCLRYTCQCSGRETLFVCSVSELRRAPLAWVEGKPVYRGDVLYRGTSQVVVIGAANETVAVETVAGAVGDLAGTSDLTWEPVKPKTKRKGWINLYANSEGDKPMVSRHVCLTRCAADELADMVRSERLACIEVEWEE